VQTSAAATPLVIFARMIRTLPLLLAGQDGKTVEYRLGTIQFTLDGGGIVASGNYLAEPDVAVPADGIFRAITGGTGDYVSARGEVEISPEDDERVRYELDFETPSD